MRKMMVLAALLPLLGGCVAQAAWDVATLPVKVAGGAVDMMTTSEKERDEKWVRQQRKAADAREKEERRAANERRRDGD